MKIILEANKIPDGSWVSEETGSWHWAKISPNPLKIVREIKIINEFNREQTLNSGSGNRYLINTEEGTITAINSCKLLCWTPTNEELVSYLKDNGII